MQSFVHVYTGDGKGKTTAALGLALRAAGAGWDVFFAQFVKGQPTSELQALERFSDRITVRRFGGSKFVAPGGDAESNRKAEEGLRQCEEAVGSGRYQLVVLDEANVAAALDVVDLERLLRLIDGRPENVELVLTGRWAPRQILDRADLVTEMREVRHYYRQGVSARRGIEN